MLLMGSKHPSPAPSIQNRGAPCPSLVQAFPWNKGEAVAKDGEGNGTPLQYSCLENPMDGGAW